MNRANYYVSTGFADRKYAARWRACTSGDSQLVVCYNNMANAYGIWRVAQLKAELTKRGAVATGRKEALIERLEDYDRNFNFENQKFDGIPNFIMPAWPTFGFKQLVAEHRIRLPKLDRSQVEAYFKFRVALDNDMVQDIKALEKGKLMLDSSKICACSVHITNKAVNFSGIVAAAMKKKVSYNYKICIDGQTGEVKNTHCECPAGQGPHGTCKHSAAVLLMIAEFIENGIIKTERSCTENAQTFHIPKKSYKGSPVKAEDLPAAKRPCLDDPRPKCFQNNKGYGDYVRNLVINYCANTGEDLTMRYLYSRADIMVATKDHDYFQRPFTDYWVDRVFEITDAECAQLERSTRGQSGCNQWHQARRIRLTASRFGDIINMTLRRNKEKLCQSICNPPKLTCPAVVHGLKFEALALKKFKSQTGLNVTRCGLFVISKFGYLGATPDGVIDSHCILEIKCPYSGRENVIIPSKEFPYLENVDGSIRLKRNSKYYCQFRDNCISLRECLVFLLFTLLKIFS